MSEVFTEEAQQLVHETLLSEFTSRYIASSGGLSRIASVIPYDPTNEVCDYTRTSFEAKPAAVGSELAPILVLPKVLRLSTKEVYRRGFKPFVESYDEITDRLREYPLMYINGHEKDLQAAMPLAVGSLALAAASFNPRYIAEHQRLIDRSHLIATRGILPISIKLPGNRQVPFNSLVQLAFTTHYNFPDNERMRQSAIPDTFQKTYNSGLARRAIRIAKSGPDSPGGFHTLWSIAPGATRDRSGEDEHKGQVITNAVGDNTAKLLTLMRVGLVPIYTSYQGKHGPNVLEIGEIIPPDEVNDVTVHNIMADLAAFRRWHGEENVYYEGEL